MRLHVLGYKHLVRLVCPHNATLQCHVTPKRDTAVSRDTVSCLSSSRDTSNSGGSAGTCHTEQRPRARQRQRCHVIIHTMCVHVRAYVCVCVCLYETQERCRMIPLQSRLATHAHECMAGAGCPKLFQTKQFIELNTTRAPGGAWLGHVALCTLD